MAVETKHLNLFPPQLLSTNRVLMQNTIQQNTDVCNNKTQIIGYGVPTTHQQQQQQQTLIFPFYNTANITTPNNNDNNTMLLNQKTPIKSEISSLTYNNNNNNNSLNLPRKRSREYSSTTGSLLSSYPSNYSNNNNNNNNNSQSAISYFSFLGNDLSAMFQQHELDIDRLVSQHMEKVRLEVEEKRKVQARRLMEAIEEGMLKRLKAKEEEILKIGKLNWALDEKVRSLSIENQIWKDLAQTNEATANALRTNLEHVLSQRTHGPDEAVADDAQSSCGSCDVDDKLPDRSRRRLASTAQDKGSDNVIVKSNGRLCKNCGVEESCVLLLPCRHLCLCGGCGSRVHVCPICNSTKNASFHVNMS